MIRLKTFLISFSCFLVFYITNAQSLPQIVASGNQLFCGESPMPIVTDVTISNGNGTLDVVYVQISTGYNQGSDVLFLDDEHLNITASWQIGEGQLTLTGPASFAEFEDAIRAVKFSTVQNNFTEDKFFSINLGGANFLPATGHYYLYVEDVGINWLEAKAAAASESYFGLQGYLATITTQEEVQLTGEQSSGTGWIGGSDQTSEGNWIWETGPEAGQVFWVGTSSGNAPNGAFSFWNTGEPNNVFGNEHYAHVTDPSIGILGSWNDLPVQGDEDINSPYHPQGYIIEFGGMAGDPNISVSASTIIVMPKVEITNNSFCDEGLVQVSLNTNTDDVLWYETMVSATVINSGISFEESISSTTTYWILPVFSDCSGGARIPITVNVYESPIANDITIIQCDDEIVDGSSSFNLNYYKDEIVRSPEGEVIETWEVSFFEDNELINEINPVNYVNMVNNQVLYVQVLDEFTGCFNVSEVILQVNSSNNVSFTLGACDDFAVDGITFFDLSEANNDILNGAPVNASIAYYTSYNDALLEINEITGEYINEVPYNDVVYARVEIDNSCYAINEVNLVVNDIPNVLQYEEVYYCQNTFPETITLEGGVTGDIPNNYYYNWSTGETTMTIEVNDIGTYEVLVRKPLGCTNKRTIVVLPSDSAEIQNIDVSDLSENNRISVLASGDGDYVYALDDENGIYQESNNFENVSTGIHSVYVKDVKADCGVVSGIISVLGFPKFLTPNGDDINDTWEIKGSSSTFDIMTTIEIFNRYGKLITVLNKSNPSWDGTHNGKLLPTDDYWFVAKLLDGRTYKGHFTLKR